MTKATPHAGRLEAWLAGAVVIAVGGFSIVARRAGLERFNSSAAYFEEFGDAGHPGVVSVATSMGFLVVAVLSLVAVATRSDRRFLVPMATFAVIAADTLVRVHHHLPFGDVVVRVVGWVAMIWIAVRLAPTRGDRVGTSVVVLAAFALLASEVLDATGSGRGSESSVWEEALMCLGAWLLVVVAVGVTLASGLSAAMRPTAAPPSRLEPTERA